MEEGRPETDSADAARGRRLHELAWTPKAERAAVLAACDDGGDADALQHVWDFLDGWGSQDWQIEQYISYPASDGIDLDGTVLFAGTPDGYFVAPDDPTVAVAVDWKFGHLPVDRAVDNLQLAAYALLIHWITGANTVRYYLVQPAFPSLSVQPHEYTAWDAIEGNIRAIIEATEQDALVLHAGEHCRYCLGKADCSAVALAEGEIAALAERPEGAITPDTAVRLWRDAATVIGKCEAIRKAVKAYVLGLPERCVGRPGDGLKAKPFAGKLTITDPGETFRALHEATDGVLDQAAFLETCRVNIGELEKAVQEAAGLKSRRLARRLIEDVATWEAKGAYTTVTAWRAGT